MGKHTANVIAPYTGTRHKTSDFYKEWAKAGGSIATVRNG